MQNIVGLPPILRRGLVTAGWGMAIAAPFVTHVTLVTGRYRLLALVVAACQVTMLAGAATAQAYGWRRWVGLAVAAGLVLLLAVRLAGVTTLGRTGLLAASGASHATIYLSLLTLFGSSLRPGCTPLITALATRVRGGLTPAMLGYTRSVTEAWCLFFVAQLAGSGLLLAAAPASWWSLFVNVLDAPLVAVMFMAEYTVRRLRFPRYHHISILETARRFRSG